ncbi:SPOR domain-containing protein [Devosia algicola]|uniref:SPOR domain-containing protein n=1 Tax=Devosia algicola TaxID=3026418 RepID=A0ABY7YR49_9HYPH|nr:SPOR domain-containing protein [Devosia algicola]WDR03360.1 SPOR domain-containing protein [Devosia algicola]
MTTAKPQQTSGNGEAADDLIAELAKLMAQDAQAERPDPKSPPAPAAAPVRIPGMAQDDSEPEQETPPRRVNVADAPAPDLVSHEARPDQQDVNTPPAPVPVQPRHTTVHPVSSAAPEEAKAVDQSSDHDAIADLIAAETEQAATASAEQPSAEPEQQTDLDQHDNPPEPLHLPGNGWAASEHLARPGGPTSPIRRANVPAVAPETNEGARSTTPDKLAREQATGSASDDNFKVAPIFGFGSPKVGKEPEALPVDTDDIEAVQAESVVDNMSNGVEPPPAVPVAADRGTDNNGVDETDPITEIENLIGEAVRVHLDPQPRPVASAALRDLAGEDAAPTPAKPVPQAPTEGSDSDSAILAAVRSSGDEVRWADTGEIDESENVDVLQGSGRKRRAGGITRAVAGPVVALGLLLVAGLGLYWVLGLGGPSDGPVPTLLADTTPTKGAPETPPVTETPQQSVVFNEIDGVTPTENETLVSRDQSQTDEVTQLASTTSTEEGLANRKVRTVTVRPDGTIVSGDDAVAGTAILPVDRPNVPEVPGAETASPELVAAAAGDAATATATATTTAEAVATPEADAPAIVPAAPGSTVPAVDTNGVPIPGKTAPVAMVRPTTFTNTNVAVAPIETAPSAPTSPINAVISEPTQQATQTQTESTAPAYVQLSSQRSASDAQSTADNLQTRFGSLFGGTGLQIQRVDLGEKGIYFRVLLPSTSLQAASQTCASVKANGGDCFAF